MADEDELRQYRLAKFNYELAKNIEQLKSTLNKDVDFSVESYKKSLQEASAVRIHEFQFLHREIDDLIKAYQRLETFSLVGVAAFYGWIALHNVAMPWVLPFSLVLLAAMRSSAHIIRIMQIAKYLKKMEVEINGDGWENYISKLRTSSDIVTRVMSGSIVLTAFLFWAALGAMTWYVGNISLKAQHERVGSRALTLGSMSGGATIVPTDIKILIRE